MAIELDDEVFTFVLPNKGGYARARISGGRAEILKGSAVAEPETKDMYPPYRKIRHDLVNCGVIKRIDGQLKFTVDWLFDRPNEAACVVEGGCRSGNHSWRNGAGKTLSELGYRK